MNPKIIGIRFGDNDFYNTFDAFFTMMAKRELEFYPNLTKEKVVELFNRSATGLYWLYQNGLEYRINDKMENYLKIDINKVYFDKEVKDFIAGKDKDGHAAWHNGEFFVLEGKTFYSV
jgi:hypothetical protein